MQAATLNCPTCGAATSSDASHCAYCGARLATIACPSCFGMMFVGSEYCPHCGKRAVLPQSSGQTSLHCPRCSGQLQQVAIGETTLNECPKCGGVWVDAESFEQICAQRERQAAVLATNLPPPFEQQVDMHKLYLACPQCHRLMNRLNFAHRSGVILDVCKVHGIWFDRDELQRIVDFIRAGGLERARAIEKEELAQQRRMVESQQRTPGLNSDYSDIHDAFRAVGGLLSFLR